MSCTPLQDVIRVYFTSGILSKTPLPLPNEKKQTNLEYVNRTLQKFQGQNQSKSTDWRETKETGQLNVIQPGLKVKSR